MIRQCDDKIFRGVRRVAVIGDILSIRVVNAAVARVGLTVCGRRNDEYIKSRKFEMSVSMSYFSRFA